ncbi:MAG: thrombospondin type 3 repeat-containing protein [Myxococcota bacterium]
MRIESTPGPTTDHLQPGRGAPRRTKTAPALLVAAGVLTVSVSAGAQEASAVDGEFSVQRFEPAIGPRNYLSVAGGRTAGELDWGVSAMFDYQREPLVVKSCISATDCDAPNAQNTTDVPVVQDMFTWNLMGSFTPVEWVQIGVRVPMAFVVGDGLDPTTGGASADGISTFGVGDAMLEGKFRVFGGPDDMIVLAAAADIAGPFGTLSAENSYIGNDSPVTGGVRAIFDFKYDDFTAAANLRGVFKSNSTLGNTTLGPELRYGVGLGYRVHPLFKVIAEGFGSTVFSTVNGSNALEVDGGVQITPLDGRLVITAAGGAGVLQGVGVPLARGMVGLGFYYGGGASDEDGDGIPDTSDQCPTDAEDLDGVADEDGCAELDYDRDKIPDLVDRCPLEPETENRYQDDDGCPDEVADTDKDGFFDEQDKCPTLPGKMRRPDALGCPDADGDFVPDHLDKCVDGPRAMEDADGFEDLDGCLDADNDQDGVPDISDECGDAAETKNGFQDEDGCPDVGEDEDGDGIADDVDRCDQVPESYNDERDFDGCSELQSSLVKITRDEITLRADIAFAADGTIKDDKGAKALRALANGLKNWVSMMKIDVVYTGGTDAAAAQKRAEAVKAYLVAKGTDAKRLNARGAAKAGDDDEEGVTFVIVEGPR